MNGLPDLPQPFRSFKGGSCDCPSGETPATPSTPLTKNIPFYRNSVLAYVSPIPAHQEGRSCGRHDREPGLRWTRQRRHEMGRAGRVVSVSPTPACGRAALLGFVSPCKFLASSTGPGILRRKGGPCVRQNRVVLTVVATVKPSRRCERAQPGRLHHPIRGGEGGQKELGSRESTA